MRDIIETSGLAGLANTCPIMECVIPLDSNLFKLLKFNAVDYQFSLKMQNIGILPYVFGK